MQLFNILYMFRLVFKNYNLTLPWKKFIKKLLKRARIIKESGHFMEMVWWHHDIFGVAGHIYDLRESVSESEFKHLSTREHTPGISSFHDKEGHNFSSPPPEGNMAVNFN